MRNMRFKLDDARATLAQAINAVEGDRTALEAEQIGRAHV